LEKKPSVYFNGGFGRNKKKAKHQMNLKQFKSRVSEIDQIIPKNKWFEIPIEDGYWRFFEYQGLYAIY